MLRENKMHEGEHKCKKKEIEVYGELTKGKRAKKENQNVKQKTFADRAKGEKMQEGENKVCKGRKKVYGSKYKFRLTRRKRQRLRERNKRCR